MVFSGMIEKEDDGWKWVFPFTEEIMRDEEMKVDEKEYYEERKRNFQIEFKKEPPKAMT